MTNPVGTILTGLKTAVQTVLGSDYKELKYVYSIEDNDNTAMKKAYGVGVRDGGSVSGITKNATIDQQFFVVLTDRFTNKSKDANERLTISSLYEKIDELNIEIFQKKVNAPDTVLTVQDISLSEPERIDKGAIAITIEYTIKYRSQTS